MVTGITALVFQRIIIAGQLRTEPLFPIQWLNKRRMYSASTPGPVRSGPGQGIVEGPSQAAAGLMNRLTYCLLQGYLTMTFP